MLNQPTPSAREIQELRDRALKLREALVAAMKATDAAWPAWWRVGNFLDRRWGGVTTLDWFSDHLRGVGETMAVAGQVLDQAVREISAATNTLDPTVAFPALDEEHDENGFEAAGLDDPAVGVEEEAADAAEEAADAPPGNAAGKRRAERLRALAAARRLDAEAAKEGDGAEPATGSPPGEVTP